MLTSPQNDRVVAARKLRQRKERVAADAFLVEGPHAVGAALDAAGERLETLFVTEAAHRREHVLVDAVRAVGIEPTLVSDRVDAALSGARHPQGVVAVFRLPHHGLESVARRSARLVAVLVEVADPGNVGTVIRTADAFGADGVVLTEGSADPYGDKCVRASAGSLFHLPIVTDVPVTATIESFAALGLQVLAAAADGADDLDALPEGDLSRPTVWLFGNEAHGLPAQVAAAAHRRVRVAMAGRAESLNLAAAAAVCLHASARAQRR